MFTLRLFGAPVVEGPEGPLSGRIAQRHPLALLSFLATAPSATASREKLLALLWPESDTEDARRLLNVAVHAVRKELGETAIHSLGASLQLDEAAVHVDVREFAHALAAGEAEHAVEAYVAPFLDGFFLDAEEFDRWADSERATLAGQLAEALERLADEAERAGDPHRAAAWWKRRAAADPCDSRVALRLMDAMSAAGDRAGALRHAAVHAALLRDELGTDADPEVEELAEQIRSGAPSALSAAEQRAAATTAFAGAASAADEETAPGRVAPSPPAASPHVDPAARASAAAAAAARESRRDRGRRARVLAASIAAAVLVAATGGLAWLGRHRAEPSIAVVPFQPLRDSPLAPDGSAQDDYFRFGLADEVIGSLARSGGIRVIARGSSFAFDGRHSDTREVGRALNVTHVLEGSVRRHQGRLRVAVDLVRVADRRIVWSDAYDTGQEDVFAVQSRIASGVVGELRRNAGAGSSTAAAAVAPPTHDPDAYDLYLQGRYAWYRRRPEGLFAAVAKFREAVAHDPRFVPAYVGLAEAYNVMGGVEYGLVPASEAYEQAVAAARRALELDPRSGQAHAALANALVNHGGSWPQAEAHFLRAIELDPGSADTYHWYSMGLRAAGREAEADNAIRRAQMLDPRSAVATAELARTLYYARRYARSAAEYRRAAEIDPSLASPHLGLGMVLEQTDSLAAAAREFARADTLFGGGFPLSLALLAHADARLGRRDEARRLLARIEEMSRRGRYVPPEYRAIVHLGLGEHAAAITLLERAYAANPGLGAVLRADPLTDPIRRDPRFARLLDAAARR